MESTTNLDATGRPGLLRLRMKRTVEILCKQWLYIGIAIFLATLNLLLGILTLSYLHPKKDELVFGIVCFAILLALGHFASLCYLIQRAKDDSSDPQLIDAAYSAGVVGLFATHDRSSLTNITDPPVSGLALTVKLPNRCFSGPNNEHLKIIGQGWCNAITAMAVSSWLAVLITSIIIVVAARRAIELAKMPPPVFPTGTEAPVMRWLDRNDPFLTVSERRQQYV
ncbi:hypothetical protein GALMADRAFT_208769 [Galerina marginata CBS 339.88]|uniref:Uncharacterized protein n=1 Tax=Galerina marginata (strain CBS 339.88) TaxID=685588 RepID=A0A067TK90_GALM3|nr:hypothetical protein GALMADRAFT_208769 [Galerina marginata CBS 339.88]